MGEDRAPTAGPATEAPGPLTRRVLEYDRILRELLPRVRTADDWAPLSELVALGEFRRIGTFLEVMDWRQYTDMLTGWASSIERFETRVKRVSEVPGLVYYEIEERHLRGPTTTVVNTLTVFAFNEESKIRHLAVYLQQAR